MCPKTFANIFFRASQPLVQQVSARSVSLRQIVLGGVLLFALSAPADPIGYLQNIFYKGDPAWHVDYLQLRQFHLNDPEILKPASCDLIVAVIDTGVDERQPELRKSYFINEFEIPNNHIDDDNNGYVDDYLGFNADRGEGSSNSRANSDHGTIVSGAMANTGFGEAIGVIPCIKILPVTVLNYGTIRNLDVASTAIEYALKRKAKVLNLSWSYKKFDYTAKQLNRFCSVLKKALDSNVIIVHAAGNSARNFSNESHFLPEDSASEELAGCTFEGPIAKSPRGARSGGSGASTGDVGAAAGEKTTYLDLPVKLFKHPLYIEVSALGENRQIWKLSNYLSDYNLFAPGENVATPNETGVWRYKSGTSFATPIVAGLLSYGLVKGLTPQQAVAALYETALPLGPPATPGPNDKVINPLRYQQKVFKLLGR